MKSVVSIVMLISLLSLTITGCGNSSNATAPISQPVGGDIIQKFNFHVVGQPTNTDLTLPQQLTDANWGLKQIVCQQAGYDLTPFSGQDITAVKYSITEKYSGEALSLVVLAKGQTSICGYATDSATPGVFAVNDPNIK